MANIKRNRFTLFSAFLLVLLLLITLAGIMTLYSTTQGGTESNIPLHKKQAIWFGLGLLAMSILIWIEHRHLEHYTYVIYSISVLMLVYVLVFGREIAGAKRWIELGPLQFQPSELMKITLIMALAKYFHQHPREGLYSLSDLRIPFLLLIVPFVLVLLQPDLGTAIILLLIFFSIVCFLGLTRQSFLTLILVGIGSLPLGWSLLHEYQKDRILTLLNPALDPLGSGYHIIQSKIAIGSGGIWGKGFMNSTQSRLHFLPEQHTDFIFAAFVEEWGFVGSLLLLGSYLLLIFWSMSISSQSKDRFGMLVALGVSFLIFYHVVINIGMCLGLLPVVGVPLPLFSYGGSFLFVMFLGIGLLMNTYVHRFIF